MRADTRYQQRHIAHHAPHIGNHLRHGRADHQTDVFIAVPLLRRELGDAQVQRFAINHLLLQIGAAGVRRAAQQDHALVGVFCERRDRIAAKIRINCYRIGAIAFKRFYCVEVGRAAHIATLGVENHWHLRIAVVDVINGRRELIFSRDGRVMGELWLVGANNVVGRINNRFVERKNRVRAIE